jgi:hypothetical protein
VGGLTSVAHAPDGTGERRPRLLVAGFASSVHVARYLELLEDSGWDVHLFDVFSGRDPHPDIATTVTFHVERPPEGAAAANVTVSSDPDRGSGIEGRIVHLARVIDEVRPDVIHAHEIAISGAIVASAREILGGFDAPLLVTNWGSDIFWNGRVPAVAARLRATLAVADYFCAECHRDVALARAFGFAGEVLGVWPVAGGVDVASMAALRVPGPTSARRTIALKGVLGAYGCADVGLAAIERCGARLRGWELCGYQMDRGLTDRARELAADLGMHYTHLSDVEARTSSHAAILEMHGRSRVSLGLNRTDALSTSFVEAVAMGSLPVQGRGSCGYELTPHGQGALFVDPRDVEDVTAALARALDDDDLVDRAAALNARVAVEHLDRRRIGARILDGYERIVSEKAMETL